MLPTNADQSYSHEKLRLAMGNNYQKWPEHAYVSIKKLGIARTTPFKFDFAMLDKKVPTVNND